MDMNTIKLDAPRLDKGIPIMQAFKNRKSGKSFSDAKLRQLSEVLWAANGINREDGKRTTPSARNKHPVDVYVILQEGVYLYDPAGHQLLLVANGDFRKLAGKQDYVYNAPVNLVYVAGMAKLKDLPGPASEEEKLRLACIETGHKAQNVYLYCASEGLCAVVRASIDKEALGKAIGLSPKQIVISAQTVGYPV